MYVKEKKLGKVSTLFVAALFLLGACSEEDGTTAVEELSVEELTSEAVVDFAADDIDNIVMNNMEAINTSIGNVANFGERFNPYRGRDNCATITRDEAAQTITVDFGEGCTSEDGIERSGRIEIHYTDRRNQPGAVITTTFVDFFVNGNQIEGTRTLTNISDGTAFQKAFEITVTGGKITFEDGTFRTFEASRTRTHEIEESSRELTITVEGQRSGVNREGESYSMVITTPLVFKNSCRQVGVRLAVSGVRQFTRGEASASIDYGDGTCDNEVTITRADGTVEVVTVNGRRRGA